MTTRRTEPTEPDGVTRRGFLARTGVVAGGVAAGGGVAAPIAQGQAPLPPPVLGPEPVPVRLRINQRTYRTMIEPRTTLLEALREDLGLTGTKQGCDQGACGACTVLVDGRRMLACLTFAVMQDGREITTIEGIGGEDRLHPVQEAFLEHDAFQCGACTPGQIMATIGLLDEDGPVADTDVRERLNGNLCRCAAYRGIRAAVRDVASRRSA